MTMPRKTKLVVGLDPGVGRVGYAVAGGSIASPQIMTFGCFETDVGLSQNKRLVELGRAVEKLLKKYQPPVVAVEKLYFSRNVKTALRVAEARGVLCYLAQKFHCQIIEFSPQEVKIAATGQGNADKNQLKKMLKFIFRLSVIPRSDDAADALALALCALGRHIN